MLTQVLMQPSAVSAWRLHRVGMLWLLRLRCWSFPAAAVLFAACTWPRSASRCRGVVLRPRLRRARNRPLWPSRQPKLNTRARPCP